MTTPTLPTLRFTEKGAQFSPDRLYRYSLWRIFDSEKPTMMFIGLNPSTADENVDDATIRRCIGFSKTWGFGGLHMLNLFAYRSTDSKMLQKVDDPIGSENDRFLKMYGETSCIVVAAWGNHGALLRRGEKVRELLEAADIPLWSFGTSKTGQPKHPLYLPRGAKISRCDTNYTK